jgi:integrase
VTIPTYNPEDTAARTIHVPVRPGGTPALPPGLTFHSLRHTYASLCVAAGIAARDFAVHGSSLLSRRSMRVAHEAHVIPPISRSTCRGAATGALSCGVAVIACCLS